MRSVQLLFTAIISQLLILNASCQVADTNAITNEQFKQISADTNVVILDVRTTEEFNEGHIPNAINIAILENHSFTKHIASLPKDRTYLLYCRSGKRSASAMNIMKENGFIEVKHLQHGTSGWDGEIVK